MMVENCSMDLATVGSSWQTLMNSWQGIPTPVPLQLNLCYFRRDKTKTRERNQRRRTTSLMIDNSDQMFLKPKGHSFETIWVTVSDRLCLAWCDRDATVTSSFFLLRRCSMPWYSKPGVKGTDYLSFCIIEEEKWLCVEVSSENYILAK